MIWKLLETCKKPYIRQNGEAFACGQCESCRRRQIQEWTVRGGHELIANDYKAILLTLTYAPKNLIIGAKRKMNAQDKKGIFNCNDMTLFIKRFRKKYKHIGKLRYIYCAEYGTKYWRPHFHILFYGITWEDLEGRTSEEKKAKLKEIWKLGKVDTDARPISINAIQYVTGYVRKKIGNKFGGKYIYEDNGRPRPCMRMSQGIGKEWNEKHMNDWLSAEAMIVFKKGLMQVPRYYIKKMYEKEGVKLHWEIKESIQKNTTQPEKEIKKRHFYKILKNPEGEMFNQFKNIQEKRFYKELKEIEDEKIKNYEIAQKKIRDDYFSEDLRAWEETEGGTQCEDWIKKKLEIYHWKKRQPKRESEEPEEKLIFRQFDLEKEFAIQRKKAENYCEGIAERQLYGRRDKYELSLEFEEKDEKTEDYRLEKEENIKKIRKRLDKLQRQKVYRLIGEQKEFAGYTIPTYKSTNKEVVEYV